MPGGPAIPKTTEERAAPAGAAVVTLRGDGRQFTEVVASGATGAALNLPSRLQAWCFSRFVRLRHAGKGNPRHREPGFAVSRAQRVTLEGASTP